MNNFLSANPTTLILSSLVRNADGGGDWEGGGGGNTETKTVCQTVKRGKIQNSNHLHNVKHVVQSTLQNM